MKKKLTMLFACALMGISSALAQTKVTGTVLSEEDGLPVIGATIKIVGSDMGTIADADGHFSLVMPAGKSELQVSHIGMDTKIVTAKNGITIVLKADDNSLDEVMVVAYGTAKKSSFTGSASVLKNETLEKRQVSNVTNALAGEVAGLQVLNNNGQPGTGSTIRIRGVGSLNASSKPLYVVDGAPFDGDLSAINTQDIESMTVLKDAASAALYGARGANGVVMITTKRGRMGKAKIKFDAKVGANQRATRNYDVLRNPATYMEKAYESLYNGAYYSIDTYKGDAVNSWRYANSNLNSYLYGNSGVNIYTVPTGQYLIGQDGKMNPNATLGYYDGQYYYTPDNWRDETYKSQVRQEYNFSVSGGTDKLNYYASLGMLDDKGIIANSDFRRYTMRSNGDYQATKWLRIGASVNYSNSSSRYPTDQDSNSSTSSGNEFWLANNIAPIYPMYVRTLNAETGNYEIATNDLGKTVYDYGDGETSNYTRPWMPGANPVSDQLYNHSSYNVDFFQTNWYATVTPIDGLKLTARLSVDIDNTRWTYTTNPWYGQFADQGGEAENYYIRQSGLDMQYLAEYTKTFADVHNFDAMVGYDGYQMTHHTVWSYGSNLYNPFGTSVDNTIDNQQGGGGSYDYSTAGFFGRVNYDYDGRYFGSVSYRRDGSSRFHPDNRWGNFYSASAAWVITKEQFMQNQKWIDFLKLKISYGEQGNDNLYNETNSSLTAAYYYYAYLDQYQMTGSNGEFADGTLVYKGNKDITWEKSKAFNVGVDFELWKGKLEGTVEWFSRKTSDMLYYKPVAASNGYTQIPMNVGAMTNSGLEIDLRSKIIDEKDFEWSVNLNATFLKNKINELSADLGGELIDGTRIYTEGESMYRRYLVKYAGVDPDTGLAQYWAYDSKAKEEYKTDDWSVASSTNKCATGDMLPTVYGGFGTSVKFHGFDASVSLSYQLGGQIYDYSYQLLMHGGSSSDLGQNWHKDILDSWSEANRYTSVPRVNSQDSYTNATSDRWMTSSDYLSLNNITVGYTLPSKLLRPIGLEKVRFYFTADNVALLSARDGLDPRTSYVTSVSNSSYSPIRTLSGGVSIQF